MADIQKDQIIQPVMKQSLTGRVRNFNLPPTTKNCLMPVYEAITNALYAIQDKYPTDWASKGIITIEVLRSDPDDATSDKRAEYGDVTGFVITDNGIGLNDILFASFQELDTEHRIEKKGRGIGRLSWLKVFQHTDIISIYDTDEGTNERSFKFKLSNDKAFDDYSLERSKGDVHTGTIVNLSRFKDGYNAKAPRKPDDICDAILSHFIALFAQPKRLRIKLIDSGVEQNLSDHFFDSIIGSKRPVKVKITENIEADVLHIKIPKKIAPIGNSIIYCAADRSVITKGINDAIGMKFLDDKEHGQLVYIALVSGEIFEVALNHERTGFDFGDTEFDDVNRILVEKAQEFLEPYLGEKREKNKALLSSLLSENPLYNSALGDVEAYVESMPLNWDETRLVQNIALKRHRAKKALFKQIEKLEANTAKMTSEEFSAHVSKLTDELGETEKSSLAQYVVERRMVIELLLQRRRLDKSEDKHESEAMVHEVFCPLGVTSDVLEYDDHNLWLLDDRLAYYSYIASDRNIASFTEDSEEQPENESERREALAELGAYGERSEPDLAIFKRPMLFRRNNTPDPAVIIEFKSPSKLKYSGAPKDNPVVQIRKYIETLQAKTCYDFEGDRITDITEDTPFHCFLIAEPSDVLYALLRSHGIYRPTPDGHGRFGYLEDLNAYFEYIPYEQVIRNAALRNEAFFTRLKLVPIKGL